MSITTQEPLHLRAVSGWQPSRLAEHAVDRLYDDAVAASRGRQRGFAQQTLRMRLQGEPVDPEFGPQATGSAALPDPQEWVRSLAAALLECMSGARGAHQVARWVSPLVHERISRRCVIARRRGAVPAGRTLIRRVHVCRPGDGIVEASVVAQHDGRVRAMALRLIGVDGRWMVTAMELG